MHLLFLNCDSLNVFVKDRGNKKASGGNDAIMDWVCQKGCRLRAGTNNYPPPYSSLKDQLVAHARLFSIMILAFYDRSCCFW